jgi:hypothetical protein
MSCSTSIVYPSESLGSGIDGDSSSTTLEEICNTLSCGLSLVYSDDNPGDIVSVIRNKATSNMARSRAATKESHKAVADSIASPAERTPPSTCSQDPSIEGSQVPQRSEDGGAKNHLPDTTGITAAGWSERHQRVTERMERLQYRVQHYEPDCFGDEIEVLFEIYKLEALAAYYESCPVDGNGGDQETEARGVMVSGACRWIEVCFADLESRSVV